MLMSWLALAVVLILFAILYMMNKKGMSFTVRILTATAMGAILGFVFKGHTSYIETFGRIYARTLQVVVIPLLLFSIVNTVASLKNMKALTSIGGKTLGVLGLHNILGSILGIAVGLLMHLGRGAHVSMPQETVEIHEVPAFTDVLTSFFPKNIVEHMANGDIIPIVLFAIMVGIAILLYPKKEEIKPFTDFLEAGNKLVGKLIGLVVQFTPYAVITLIANQVGGMDWGFVSALLLLLLAVYICSFIHTFITTGLMVGAFGRINPFIFLKKFFPAWLIAFSTQSSVGTIPANVEAQKEMGVPENIASFAASVGTTFGMPGCAAFWPCLLAMFTINNLSIHWGVTDFFMLIGIALLASLGTVGVPGTGTIQATAVFTAMGLPIEMILILSPIAGVADMGRTSTNVQAGGSTGVIVAALEKELDLDQYHRKVEMDTNTNQA